jgi:uracil-DNA glycosylase
MSKIKLSNRWLNHLEHEFEKEYMKNLKKFLESEYQKGKIIYPAKQNYFAALNIVEPEDVKVVILGQDPYHGEGQAHGLCFSVPDGAGLPPSLQNIYKELHFDLKVSIVKSGDLTRWARQGVLLLNSVLTVEKDLAASHQKKGWEQFTDKIIQVIDQNCDRVVFILWGAYAQKKSGLCESE